MCWFINDHRGDGKSKRSITLQEIKQLLDIFIPPHVHFTVQHVDTQTSSSDSVITSVMSDVQKLPFVAGNEVRKCISLLLRNQKSHISCFFLNLCFCYI